MKRFSIPINKGNYSLDTKDRERSFERKRSYGVEIEYQENRKSWKFYPRNSLVSEYPLLVDLELSSVCNLKCPFCYTSSESFKESVKPSFMDFGLFKKVIDEIGGKVFAVRLSLRGEPTIHPDFIRAIEYAKTRSIKEISTLTNASKMTLGFFKRAMKAGIDWITISFDGLYKNYEINRNPLKFNIIYSRLSRIKEFKEKNHLVKPVIKVQSIWPAIRNDPKAYYEKMAKICDLVAFNPLIDFEINHLGKKIQFEENFSCPQLYQRIVIGSDGKVMMCANDEKNDVIIGDANLDTIYKIWHGERLNRIRKIHKIKGGFKQIPVCRKCYLPRKTVNEVAKIGKRKIIVKNYSGVS